MRKERSGRHPVQRFPKAFCLLGCLFPLGVEKGEKLLDLPLRLLGLLLGLVDPMGDGPVGQQPVEEIIGKPQETVDPDGELRLQADVGQLCLEAVQLLLELLGRCLGLVQAEMLGKAGNHPSPQEIAGGPALGVG